MDHVAYNNIRTCAKAQQWLPSMMIMALVVHDKEDKYISKVSMSSENQLFTIYEVRGANKLFGMLISLSLHMEK